MDGYWRAAIAALAMPWCAAVGSCNAILGIEDRPLRPDAASAIDGSGSESSVSSTYASAVLADAPLLYLRFGERSGATAVDELHRFDGTYPAAGITLGVPGAIAGDTAIALDGSSKILMPPGVEFSGVAPFSLEIWIKSDASSDEDQWLLDHQKWGATDAIRHGWDLVAGSTGVKFGRWTDGATRRVLGASAVSTLQWHHVLATYTGTVQSIFIDGALAVSDNSSIAVTAIDGTWSIGGQNCNCTTTFFRGAIDELAIYDRALSPARMRAHLTAAGR